MRFEYDYLINVFISNKYKKILMFGYIETGPDYIGVSATKLICKSLKTSIFSL